MMESDEDDGEISEGCINFVNFSLKIGKPFLCSIKVIALALFLETSGQSPRASCAESPNRT